MQLIQAALVVTVYLFLYIIFGNAFKCLFNINVNSFSITILMGFFVYFSLFQVVALPMKIFRMPLLLLSICWVITILAICFISLYVFKAEAQNGFLYAKESIIKNRKEIVFLAIIILVHIVIVEFNGLYGSIMDASYYIGEITSSVYTNTIEQYDPYTGRLLEVLNKSYLLENYGTHSAVICQLVGIHPLIETRTCLTAVIILLSRLAIFKIGLNLFKADYWKSLIMVLFTNLFSFCPVSLYTPTMFLFNRSFEGKTVLVSVIIPFMFLLLTEYITKDEEKAIWPTMFVTVFGAFCLNMTSVFVIPLFVIVFFVPAIIIKKHFSSLVKLALSVSPCYVVILYCLIYVR